MLCLDEVIMDGKDYLYIIVLDMVLLWAYCIGVRGCMMGRGGKMAGEGGQEQVRVDQLSQRVGRKKGKGQMNDVSYARDC